MAADLTVFDSTTVIDHATFERPDLPSEGIRHVVVNGKVALRDGRPTGEKAGAALRRTPQMPSRPLLVDGPREVVGSAKSPALSIAIRQGAAPSVAAGSFKLTDPLDGHPIRSTVLGLLQTAPQWASLTGLVRVGGGERPFVLLVELADPVDAPAHQSTATILIEGRDPVTVRLDQATIMGGPSR